MNTIKFSESSFIYFTNSTNNKKKYNIIKILENNSNTYKNKFSKIIAEYEYKKVFKKKNSSITKFWYLSDFFEKNIWKNKEILDLLKLIVLEDILKDSKILELNLKTNDFKIYFYLLEFCEKKNIKFSNNSKINFNYKKIVFKLKYFFTPFVEIFFFIKESLLNISFKIFKKKLFDKKNLIISYSTILKDNKVNDFYWKNLDKNINNLNSNKLIINSDNKNNFKKISVIKKNKYDNIVFLQSYQSIVSLLFSLIIWLFYIFNLLFFRNKKLPNYFIKTYFLNCFFKSSFLRNINYFFLFKNFFKKSQYEKIYYLFENISWEKSLNLCNIKSKLLPFQHTSVRDWDFRYHLFNFEKKFLKIFMPNYVYANSKYNRFKLIKNLSGIKIYNSKSTRYSLLIRKINKVSSNTILILGDIDNNETNKMIELLRLNNKFKLHLKVHPAADYTSSSKNIKLVKGEINQLLSKYNRILCSNSTTSVFEVIVSKRKPFVYWDLSKINLCPLKNFKGVNFITSGKDLTKFNNANTNINHNKFIKKFF